MLAFYPSAQAAQIVTRIDRMSIGKICRGEKGRETAGGYLWKFTTQYQQNKTTK